MKKNLTFILILCLIGAFILSIGCTTQPSEPTALTTVSAPGQPSIAATNPTVTITPTPTAPEFRGTFVGRWCLNSGSGPTFMDLKPDYTVTFDEKWNRNTRVVCSENCECSNVILLPLRWKTVDDIVYIMDNMTYHQKCDRAPYGVLSYDSATSNTWVLTFNKSNSELSGGPGGSWVQC